MKEELIYPKYRYVMGVIVILAAALTVFSLMCTSPILTFFVDDFKIDMAMAGYASTLHVIFMGIFMFIGPIIIGYIDIKKTQLIGLAIIVSGLLMAWKAVSFPMLLAARIITGIGHGVSGSCTNSVIAAWFPPKEKSVMITINNLGIVAISAIGYAIVVPLSHSFGSWRGVMLMFAVMMAAIWVVWVILGRDNHAMNEYIAQKNADEGKKTNAFSGMKEAVTRKDIWVLSLYMGLATVAANGISTYLPQFLQNVRGYTDVAASATVGVTTAIGAAGTFLGGIVTTGFGRRRITIIPFIFMTAAFGCLALLMKIHALIALMLFLYTFVTNFRSTASWTIATEVDGVTPALASSASAMIYGVGFIGTLAVAPMYSVGEKIAAGTGGMLIFIPLFVIAALFACALPETGPRKGLPLKFQWKEKKKA